MTQQGFSPGPDPNAPPQQMNPYAPPVNAGYAPMGFVPTIETPGSFPLGFLAGFFGGCIGFLLVRMLAKGAQTKKGAGVGWAVGMGVGLLLRLIAS